MLDWVFRAMHWYLTKFLHCRFSAAEEKPISRKQVSFQCFGEEIPGHGIDLSQNNEPKHYNDRVQKLNQVMADNIEVEGWL